MSVLSQPAPEASSPSLDARALVSAHRAFDPWSSEHFTFLLVANALAVVLIAAGWYQASGALAFRTQLSWLELCIVGLLIAGAANALWLLRGRQAVALGRMQVLSARQRAELFPLAAPVVSLATAPAPMAAMWVAGTVRYHRPDCVLVVGKDARPLAVDETSGLSPCEACQP
jgi:hypothetical protein